MRAIVQEHREAPDLLRRAAHAAAMREMPTPELTRVLEAAMKQHQPPLVRGAAQQVDAAPAAHARHQSPAHEALINPRV